MQQRMINGDELTPVAIFHRLHRRNPSHEPERHHPLPRSRRSTRRRCLARGRSTIVRLHPDSRGLSRSPGYRRGVRRDRRAGERGDAWESLTDQYGARRPFRRLVDGRHALSLARRTRDRTNGHGGDDRRRHHGTRTPDASDVRCLVPSRVDWDPGRTWHLRALRPAVHEKTGARVPGLSISLKSLLAENHVCRS